jgi:hypothetical protein
MQGGLETQEKLQNPLVNTWERQKTAFQWKSKAIMKGRNFRIMLEQAGKSCEWLGGAEVLCKQFEANDKTEETIGECEKCRKE